MAEGHTEDADALATYALTCVQLRSDYKQSLINEKTSKVSSPKTDREKDKQKDKKDVEKDKNVKKDDKKDGKDGEIGEKKEEKVGIIVAKDLGQRKSSFATFFGGGKEKQMVREKEMQELKNAVEKQKEIEKEKLDEIRKEIEREDEMEKHAEKIEREIHGNEFNTVNGNGNNGIGKVDDSSHVKSGSHFPSIHFPSMYSSHTNHPTAGAAASNQSTTLINQSTAAHEHQSTAVPMQKKVDGAQSAGAALGVPVESSRGMEILMLIEVMPCLSFFPLLSLSFAFIYTTTYHCLEIKVF